MYTAQLLVHTLKKESEKDVLCLFFPSIFVPPFPSRNMVSLVDVE